MCTPPEEGDNFWKEERGEEGEKKVVGDEQGETINKF